RNRLPEPRPLDVDGARTSSTLSGASLPASDIVLLREWLIATLAIEPLTADYKGTSRLERLGHDDLASDHLTEDIVGVMCCFLARTFQCATSCCPPACSALSAWWLPRHKRRRRSNIAGIPSSAIASQPTRRRWWSAT